MLTDLSNFYGKYLIDYALTESGITPPLLLLKTVTPAFSSQNAGVFSCQCTCLDKALIYKNGLTKFPSMLALYSLVAPLRVLEFFKNPLTSLFRTIANSNKHELHEGK